MKPHPDADPYAPRNGDPAWSALRYELELDYRIGTNRLDGVARIRGVAREACDRVSLDLHGLSADRVEFDGARVKKPSTSAHKLTVAPQKPLAAGDEFDITVRYRGAPRPIRTTWGRIGWEELADGVIVASQPTGAPSWFPCNDRPDDKAPYRISITCDGAYDVVANGELVDKRRAGGSTTWSFETREPMATYLATVQIGRYRTQRLRGGPAPVTIHRPADLAAAVKTDFGRVPDMLALYADRFGPYPFDAYSVVVTADELDIPLEAHGMAVFGRNHVDGRHGTDRLIAHELAHQWFGNSATLARWQDIWLHEGFACYAEWIWAEHNGDETADSLAERHRAALLDQPQDLVVADPGPKDMFDDRVYKRGALALHALRRSIGDDAFFAALRALTETCRHGTVTPAHLLDAFADAWGADAARVSAVIGPWIDDPGVPSLPSDVE